MTSYWVRVNPISNICVLLRGEVTERDKGEIDTESRPCED
jgi:hypothetical protein